MSNDQLEALLLELAGLETECPECQGQGGCLTPEEAIMCGNCGGTGKVFLFEAVRKPCSCIACDEDTSAYQWNLMCRACMIHHGKHGDWCQDCQGRGWVLSRDLADWIKACLKRGWIVKFYPDGQAIIIVIADQAIQGSRGSWSGQDPNPLVALLLAISDAEKEVK